MALEIRVHIALKMQAITRSGKQPFQQRAHFRAHLPMHRAHRHAQAGVYAGHALFFPAAAAALKAESNFPRRVGERAQGGKRGPGGRVVSHKHHMAAAILRQRFQHIRNLRKAHGDENHIVFIPWSKRRDGRHALRGGAQPSPMAYDQPPLVHHALPRAPA